MFPMDKIAATTTISRGGTGVVGRLYAMYLGTIVLIGAVALIGLSFGLDSDPQPATTVAAAADVTDGWLPSISYANRQRAAAATVDGWASALLKPDPAVVDGWAVRYLVSDDD
jgi:hypothetical protein